MLCQLAASPIFRHLKVQQHDDSLQTMTRLDQYSNTFLPRCQLVPVACTVRGYQNPRSAQVAHACAYLVTVWR
jgi:hypothetical protein